MNNLRSENVSLLDALIKFLSRIFFSVIYSSPLEITLVSYEINRKSVPVLAQLKARLFITGNLSVSLEDPKYS